MFMGILVNRERPENRTVSWRGIGLATRLLASLVRRARRDGYATIEGWVMAQNRPMLAVARKLHFSVEPVSGDAAVLRVMRAL
jgi:acetyltransferase